MQRTIPLILLLSSALVCNESAYALDTIPTKRDIPPVLLKADEIVHHKDIGLLVARGHVEASSDKMTLYADTVTYNQSLERISATGQVRLHDDKGDIIFLDYAELSDDFKQGLVENIKMLLSDNSKLAALKATRDKGKESVLSYGTYSPCNVCKKDPKRPPLWQIKSEKVRWDEEKDDIIYSHAFLEMFGVPVAYTPYLSHPAPNVKRRSGILAPIFGASSDLGPLLGLPYYMVIDESKDVTLTPVYVGKTNFLLNGEYRHRLERGEFDISGSITRGDVILKNDPNSERKRSFRGHLFAHLKYNLNKNLRASLQFERATDQTYLKRFGFLGLGNKNVLTSKANLEGFFGRSYVSLENYRFQGLRTDDRDATTPLILPVLNAHYIAKNSYMGEEWRFNFNALNLARREGNSVRRISTNGSVHLPIISSWGNVYDLGAKVRGDLYNGVIIDDATRARQDEMTARFLPQVFANWRFPLIKSVRHNHFMIEPVAGLVIGTHSGLNTKIPVEDTTIEYSLYNFDSDSRFAGLDIVDGGTRFNYGANFDTQTHDYGKANVFVGQSLSVQKPAPFLQNTGLDNRLSDLVAGIRYGFQDWLDLRSRSLLDRSTWTTKRHEFYIKFGQPVINISGTYTLLPKQEFFNVNRKTEQMGLALNTQFNPFWSGNMTSIRELGSRGGSLSHGVGLTYTDECFIFSASLTKNFYRDRDLKPGTTIFFRLVFKNIGEISQSTTMNNKDVTDPLGSERRRFLGIF